MTLIPELERELTHAIGLHTPGARRAWWQRVPLLASLATVLLGTAVALAATGVVRFGAPESAPGSARVRPPSPTSGFGTVRRGSTHLLGVRVADPGGGLPWGIRVSTTARGLGCVAVGRVLDGELGTLGVDGAFANDRRFHPLPAELTTVPGECAPLDARGELFIAVGESDVPRSGSVFRRCNPPGMAVRARRDELCPEQDERNLYYGLLGPQATSISYATSSPITRITYRGGLVCRFSRSESPTPTRRCTTPPGYVPASTLHPTAAQLHTPITATVSRSPTAAWSITVAFRARVAIANALNQYTVELQQPGTPRARGLAGTSSDLRGGQQARLIFSNLTRSGLYTGTVTFTASSSRPGGLVGLGGPLVGRFSVRIP